jgi:hypothetical protein
MADVSIRHKTAGRPPAPTSSPKPAGANANVAAPAARTPRPVQHIPRLWQPNRPLVLIAAVILLIVALGGLTRTVIQVYHDAMVLTGLTADPSPVKLAVGAEELLIPGNMLRSERTRRGGPVERADLALHWPNLEGYSDALADAFRDDGANAPIVYATISTRDEALDSTGRLDEVYSRFFVDKPLPGPAGLVGRRLSAESGYGGEIVYFMPSEPRPFVARCLAEATPEVPATCLRDVNFGRGLSVLYRFNKDLLADWRRLDTGMQKLVGSFVVPD